MPWSPVWGLTVECYHHTDVLAEQEPDPRPLFFLGFVQTLAGFVLNFMAYIPSFPVPSWPGDRGCEGCH